MAAATYNLTGSASIERGACYSYNIDLNFSTGEFDLTNYAVSGFLWRKWDGIAGPTFTATFTGPTSGQVNLALSETQTASLSLDEYTQEVYVYPPNSGCPIRIIEGDVMTIGGGKL